MDGWIKGSVGAVMEGIGREGKVKDGGCERASKEGREGEGEG